MIGYHQGYGQSQQQSSFPAQQQNSAFPPSQQNSASLQQNSVPPQQNSPFPHQQANAAFPPQQNSGFPPSNSAFQLQQSFGVQHFQQQLPDGQRVPAPQPRFAMPAKVDGPQFQQSAFSPVPQQYNGQRFPVQRLPVPPQPQIDGQNFQPRNLASQAQMDGQHFQAPNFPAASQPRMDGHLPSSRPQVPPSQQQFNGQFPFQHPPVPPSSQPKFDGPSMNYQQQNFQQHQPKFDGQPYNYQQQNFAVPPHQQQHFDRRSVNLLQERNILPPEPVDPPKIRLPPIFEHKGVNCSPDIFRCTLTAIPQTCELLKKARLPLGLVMHPFKDMKQLSVLQSSIIVRCRSCRTYINPFATFPDQRHWKCNVCERVNDLPEEFHFDPATKTYGEPSRRPEIKNSTVEFIAPSEYMPIRKNVDGDNEVRPPQASAYVFLLDITVTAIETGYLEEFCTRLIENLDHIPGDHRTLFTLIAVDSNLHYFLFRDGMQPKEFIVNDIEDFFLPWNCELLMSLREKKEALKQFLQQLPSLYANNKDCNFALGAGLTSAHQLLKDIGGRITVFQASLANLGPGALTSREDPNLRAAKDVTNLGPAIDFYKKLSLESCSHQVALDLFLFSSSYTDVATLSEMSKFCGGSVHYYPGMHAIRNAVELERFSGDLSRYLSRKIGWEAVLRIRCSKGLSLHTFHGNFFVRSTDLLAMANVNPDAAFGVQVQMDENLYEHTTVTFQAALLYTSSRGERRIRVHTMCLPVTSSLADIQQGADVHTVVSLLAKMAVDRSVNGSLSDAREALVNACMDAFGSYASSFAPSQRVGALLAPESLKLFPLYILGLLKHPAFAYGTSIKLDHRVFAMNSFKTMPHYYLIRQIYPDLYPLHMLTDQTMVPPVLQLSYEKIDRNGAYLMDNGYQFYLYICQAVSDTFCRNVFGVATFGQIDEDLAKLPDLENPQSEAITNFISSLRSKRPFYSPIRIIREDSPNRELFVHRLVDDRSDSTFSYVEFLQHLHKELNPR